MKFQSSGEPKSTYEFEVSSDKYLEKVLTPTLRNSLKCTYR